MIINKKNIIVPAVVITTLPNITGNISSTASRINRLPNNLAIISRQLENQSNLLQHYQH